MSHRGPGKGKLDRAKQAIEDNPKKAVGATALTAGGAATKTESGRQSVSNVVSASEPGFFESILQILPLSPNQIGPVLIALGILLVVVIVLVE